MHPALRYTLSNDLAARAKSGSIIYTVIWLLLAFYFGIYSSSFLFFLINTFILIGLSFSRLYTAHLIEKHNQFSQKLHSTMCCLLVMSGFHWGGMTAWLIYVDNVVNIPKDEFVYILFTIESGFAMGGASIFSISNKIRVIFPISILIAPSITLYVSQYKTANVMLALMAVALIYIIHTSKRAHDDYWASLHNKLLAETKSKELETLSITDALTSLRNRLYFDKVFRYEWDRCSRDETQLALLVIDLDFFKRVNDQYGHLAGDKCLIHTAELIKKVFKRKTDTIARYGGEEFVVLMPNANRQLAEQKAGILLDTIRNTPLEYDEQSISFTCSIGIAITQCNSKTNMHHFFKRADDALYAAKNAGRDQVQFP